MCGRYASFRESQDLADAFDVEDMTDAAKGVLASWNVAPTDGVRIVLDRARRTDGAEAGAPTGGDPPDPPPVRREMHVARWGLVPSWAKDVKVGARMFNARSESLAQKPAFSKAVTARRCLVLADGYYEWRKVEVAG